MDEVILSRHLQYDKLHLADETLNRFIRIFTDMTKSTTTTSLALADAVPTYIYVTTCMCKMLNVPEPHWLT